KTAVVAFDVPLEGQCVPQALVCERSLMVPLADGVDGLRHHTHLQGMSVNSKTLVVIMMSTCDESSLLYCEGGKWTQVDYEDYFTLQFPESARVAVPRGLCISLCATIPRRVHKNLTDSACPDALSPLIFMLSQEGLLSGHAMQNFRGKELTYSRVVPEDLPLGSSAALVAASVAWGLPPSSASEEEPEAEAPEAGAGVAPLNTQDNSKEEGKREGVLLPSSQVLGSGLPVFGGGSGKSLTFGTPGKALGSAFPSGAATSAPGQPRSSTPFTYGQPGSKPATFGSTAAASPGTVPSLFSSTSKNPFTFSGFGAGGGQKNPFGSFNPPPSSNTVVATASTAGG
ncbi:unnamed protein product, partial [Discosporangium mesarthrocarpum]